MAIVDERTKGTNKEVMQKVLQSAYNSGLITRTDLDKSAQRLEEIKPSIYSGLKFDYKPEDLTQEELDNKGTNS